MFEIGDIVDVVYTSDMETHGISLDIISAVMKNNPQKIRMRNGNTHPSYYLRGSGKIWPPWMLVLALPREPDWEI